MDEQEQQNTVSNVEQEMDQVAPTPPSPPSAHKKLIIGIVAVFVLVAVFFVNWESPKIGKEGRVPNKYELLYLNTAVANNDSSFCNKIYPKAYTVASLAVPRGYEVQYIKAKCYWGIAINSRNEQFCSEVEVANTWFADGSKLNTAGCIAEIKEFKGTESTIHATFLKFEYMDSLFSELGYTDETIPKEYWDNYNMVREAVIRAYWSDIKRTQDFMKKVKSLPSFSQ